MPWARRGGQCRRALQPDWSADTLGLTPTDGLYGYDEAARIKAAQFLHDSLSDKVYGSLKEALANQGAAMKVIADAIDDVGRGAFIAAAEAGAVAIVGLLTPIVGPVVAGIVDAVFAEQLIELLYDMPDDIANQVCNSFAFDCHRGFPGDTRCVDAAGNEIRDVDSSNWSDAPGRGLAVSPDNIHMFWDAPLLPLTSGSDFIQGLYGYNVPVNCVVGVVKRPKCVLVPSTGTAGILGAVLYRGKHVVGAYVKVNCQTTLSDVEGIYSFEVRSGGQYKIVARFETASGLILYGERTTGKSSDPPIAPGAAVRMDILLSEPPACMRNVIVTGQVRVDDVYLTGADHDDNFFNRTLYVQYGVATFDQDAGSWVIDPDDPVGVSRRTDVAQVGASTGDTNGQLKIEVAATKDLSVDVTVTGMLEELKQVRSAKVQAGATVIIDEFVLDTGGPFNDRAYFRAIMITNQAAQAI